MSNVIAMLQPALAQQADVSLLDPFRQYNVAHFGTHDEDAEKVAVVVGPVVGKVRLCSATWLTLVHYYFANSPLLGVCVSCR